MITSYEAQLSLVHDLPHSRTEDSREISWGRTPDAIGLARSPHGRIEIFLPGPKLEAQSRRVRDALEYQQWFRAGDEELLANRILLPAAGHFEQVAAFLTTELVRNGATTDLARAFTRTEPLIDLAIEDLLLAEESLLGLCGELLVLQALLRAAPVDQTSLLVTAWKGHRHTARDFQLATLGLEVKTTTGAASSHLFSGVHQLEVGHGVDGSAEDAYFLVSLGLEWSDEDDADDAISLPQLVDQLIARIDESLGLAGASLGNDLLTHIADYGGSSRVGYDHRTMSDSSRFKRQFRVAFARAYDMDDDAILLLTTEELRLRPFIEIDSISLRVNFPPQVRGDVNPITGLSTFAAHVVAFRDA